MMYGHVDTPAHWVAHLRVLRGIQERPAAFTEFVLLPFIHENAPIYLPGWPAGTDPAENRAVHAVSRLLLHGAIDSIQCSWSSSVRTCARHPAGRRQRCGRHADGGDHQPDGGRRQRLIPDDHPAQGDDAPTGRPMRQRTTSYGEVPADARPPPPPATASAPRSGPRCRCWDDREPGAVGPAELPTSAGGRSASGPWITKWNVVASRTKPFRQVGGLIVGVVFPLHGWPSAAKRRICASMTGPALASSRSLQITPVTRPQRRCAASPLARLDALAWFGERVLAQLFVEEGEDDAGSIPGSDQKRRPASNR